MKMCITDTNADLYEIVFLILLNSNLSELNFFLHKSIINAIFSNLCPSASRKYTEIK